MPLVGETGVGENGVGEPVLIRAYRESPLDRVNYI